MRTITSILFAILVVSLAGCLPNATIYYRPSVDIDSTHEKSHCVPVEKYVHFTIETKNHTLKVRGYGNTYSHAYAKGSEGQYVISGNWKEIGYKNDDFFLVVPGREEKIRPTKIYHEQHRYADYSSYNSGAVFPKQDADSFDVIFPALIVDGEAIVLPVLHIKRTLWTGISPFNC